jgi:hypothetical protein
MLQVSPKEHNIGVASCSQGLSSTVVSKLHLTTALLAATHTSLQHAQHAFLCRSSCMPSAPPVS